MSSRDSQGTEPVPDGQSTVENPDLAQENEIVDDGIEEEQYQQGHAASPSDTERVKQRKQKADAREGFLFVIISSW
jgi:hypothetical protein